MTQDNLNMMLERNNISPAIKKIIQKKMQPVVDFTNFMIDKWILTDDEFEDIFRDYLSKFMPKEIEDVVEMIKHRGKLIKEFAEKNEYYQSEEISKADVNYTLFICGLISLDEFLRDDTSRVI
jgi:hypothetical protein